MQHTIDISEYVMWCGGVVVWWCAISGCGTGARTCWLLHGA